MNRSSLSSFALAQWQEEFVSQYLKEPKAKSLLVAAPGTGKTVTALYAANKMLESGIVDSILVITDRVALREQWHHAAKGYGIDHNDTLGSLTSKNETNELQFACLTPGPAVLSSVSFLPADIRTALRILSNAFPAAKTVLQ